MAHKVILFIFFIRFATIYALFECPLLESDYQCLCYKKSETLRCNEIYHTIVTNEEILFKSVVIEEQPQTKYTIPQNLTTTNLCIQNNKFTEIGELSLLSKTSLETLILRGLLTQSNINSNVGNLTSARLLIVEDNKLFDSLGPNMFIGSHNLTKIYLQNNAISTIDPDAFVGLNKLREIKLDRNLLKVVKSPIIIESSLIDISMSQNTDLSFPNGITSSNMSIINVYLENINLVRFSDITFKPFLSNEKNMIFLRDNLINCCNETWVFDKYSYKRQINYLICLTHEKSKIDIFRLGINNLCEKTQVTTGPSMSTTVEPLAPSKQPERSEPTTSATILTTEPSPPTKQPGRTESATEPPTPVKQPDRTEPEPPAPTKQPGRTEPATEPPTPVKQPDRTEPEPPIPTKQPGRTEPTTEPPTPVKQPDRTEPEPPAPVKQPDRTEPEPPAPVKQPDRVPQK